jgi:hypothetical protein
LRSTELSSSRLSSNSGAANHVSGSFPRADDCATCKRIKPSLSFRNVTKPACRIGIGPDRRLRYRNVQVRLPPCRTAIKLRDAGFDAKYMNSGHSGWKAIGPPVKMMD